MNPSFEGKDFLNPSFEGKGFLNGFRIHVHI